MLLHLIQDCSTGHVIDKIDLVSGHSIESSLINNSTDELDSSGRERSDTISSYVVPDGSDFSEEDHSFGLWFLLHLIDWVSVNCTNRQVEWCTVNKETMCIKYMEDEEYDMNLDEMFDHAQRLIGCIQDEQYSPAEKHEALVQFLYHQVLPQIRISQQDLDLVKRAFHTQEQHIGTINTELEAWNHMRTAFKYTMVNLQEKLIPSLIKHPQLRSLYPGITSSLCSRLDLELAKLKRGTLTEKVKVKTDEIVRSIKHLHKPGKTPSKSWKKMNPELLEETEGVFEAYEATEREMLKVRAKEKRALSAKVKATQIKEQLRSVEDELSRESETYGYDIPSSHSRDTLSHSHHSLYDSVLRLIQDVSQDVGLRHQVECNWIIEQCKLTEINWKENPDLIPSTADMFNADRIDSEFLLVSEPDIFTVIVERISTQCAYTVGQLIKLIPRIRASPSSTKRLVLTYETIVYKRVTEYIMPLFDLRYKNILDQLSKDIKELTWQDLDIEEEWLLSLLNSKPTPELCSTDNHTSYTDNHLSYTDNHLSYTDNHLSYTDNHLSHPLTHMSDTDNQLSQADNQTVDHLSLTDKDLSQTGNHIPHADDSILSAYGDNPVNLKSKDDLQSSLPTNQHSSDTSFNEGSVKSTNSSMQVNSNTTKMPSGGGDSLPSHIEGSGSGTLKAQSNSPSLSADSSSLTESDSIPVSGLSLKRISGSDHTDSGFHELKQSPRISPSAPPQSSSASLVPASHEHNNIEPISESSPKSVEISSIQPMNSNARRSSLRLDLKTPILCDKTTDFLENDHLADAANSSIASTGAAEGSDVSTELEELLDDALNSLDREEEKLIQSSPTSFELRRTSSLREMRSRSSEGAHIASQSPKPTTRKVRSKSAGAKSKSRSSQDRVKRKGSEDDSKQQSSLRLSSSQATPLTTPQSPSMSPRLLQMQVKTRKNVENVLSKRRSRRLQSKRVTRPSTPGAVASSTHSLMADGGDNMFTYVFQESMQCLIDMGTRHSPLEKAQSLAKCLRCISGTISHLRSQVNAATTSDDLVTVAIVLLMNMPLQQFRSIYVQLKFISTYMDEFMDAGIHNFACIQFIGAMHFIQDQILTKRHKLSSNESRC